MIRSRIVLLAVFCLSIACFGQSRPKSSSSPTAQVKRFCQPDGGFCFSYPAGWSVLGEAFGDGVVVAPPQAGDRTLWNVVTVALIVPPPEEGQSAMSIDQVIDTALNNMRASGHNPATLERQQRTLGGLPAQTIKVRYHDDESGRDWIEELAFIEGPDEEIYSASLKAQPADVERLQSPFESLLRSWRLQTAEGKSAQLPGASSSGSKPASPQRPHP